MTPIAAALALAIAVSGRPPANAADPSFRLPDVVTVRTDIVIDTGSETSIGNRALERALAKRGVGIATTIHSVTGQDIAATFGLVRELAIQTIQIRNPMVTFADAPTFAALQLEKKPALLLGMHDLRLFRRFAIDFASRKIMFDLPS